MPMGPFVNLAGRFLWHNEVLASTARQESTRRNVLTSVNASFVWASVLPPKTFSAFQGGCGLCLGAYFQDAEAKLKL